jgi:hypothetical protein
VVHVPPFPEPVVETRKMLAVASAGIHNTNNNPEIVE